MGSRRTQYLYIYESLQITETEANIGTGKTLRARICATREGDPTEIGGLEETATATAGVYTITFARADLLSDLGDMVGQTVWLHLDDGAAGHDVHAYRVTDVDPDLQIDAP